MSRHSARRMRSLLALLALLLTGPLGCWEQWSNNWFPQMKWQPAVQAFESTMRGGKVDPFLAPEGGVPIDGGVPPLDPNDEAASNLLVNPRPVSPESIENGRQKFTIFCLPCHGQGATGDGPVSFMGEIQGPFVGVMPLAGPAGMTRIRSEGHLYTTIRYGRRRMPSYWRIPAQDRWDIVNYIRYLGGQVELAP